MIKTIKLITVLGLVALSGHSLAATFADLSAAMAKKDPTQCRAILPEIDPTARHPKSQAIPAMYALNLTHIKFTAAELDAFIHAADLHAVDRNGWNLLIYAIVSSAKDKRVLTPAQWDYLLANSDLTYRTAKGYAAADFYTTITADTFPFLTEAQEAQLQAGAVAAPAK